jgi:hypothetical protein
MWAAELGFFITYASSMMQTEKHPFRQCGHFASLIFQLSSASLSFMPLLIRQECRAFGPCRRATVLGVVALTRLAFASSPLNGQASFLQGTFSERVVVHRSRTRASGLPMCRPGRELFMTTAVNMVGSVPLRLGQLALTYWTSAVDRLLPRAGT